MRIVQSFLIVLLLMSSCNQVNSQADQAQEKKKKISFVREIDGIKEYKLDNGMKLILKPDNSKPSFSWQVWYKVGSRNEKINYTGIAHYLEHIMFKGTNLFAKGEIAQAIQLRGGVFNAFTSDDYTAYFENFAPENLELAIKIEADRMRNAKIDKEEVELERSVIVSELEGNRNSPFNRLYENLKAQAYSVHTYRNPIIGWRDDLDNINSEKIREFYDTFYYPNNATAILVGNFDEVLALDLLEKYFGDHEANKNDLPKVPQEPQQDGQKEMTIYNEGHSKILGIAFHIPEFVHEDTPALNLIGDIVFNGISSRLYPKLVDSGLVTSVSGVCESSIDAGIFRVIANMNPDADIKEVEKIIDTELDAIKKEIKLEELDIAKAKEKASFVYQRDGAYDEGMQIGYFEALSNDWSTYTSWLAKVNAVTQDKLKAIAKKYFTQANKTVVRLIPEEAPENLIAEDFDHSQKKDHANYGAAVAEPISPEKFEKLMKITEAQHSKDHEFPVADLSFEDLSNKNLKFYFKHDTTLPLIYANVAFYAGNAMEEKRGLAYITAKMLSRGSKNYDKFASSKIQDLYGADIDITANRVYAKVHFSTISDHLDKVLDLLKDNLHNPLFSQDELDKLKELVVARLKQEEDSPSRVANREMTQIIYPDEHPLHVPSIEDRIKAIESIKLDDVKEFYRDYYNPENIFVSIVGDIEKQKAQALVDDVFMTLNADVKKSKNKKPKLKDVKLKEAEHLDIDKPDKTQSEIVIAHASDMKRSDADFYPLYMANYSLGGSALSSRLGTVVRDENGLVYNIRSGVNAGIIPGMFKIILGSNPKNVFKAIKLTKDTVAEFLENGITEIELKMTKSYLTGSFPVRTLASMESLAETLLQMLVYELDRNYIRDYSKNLNAVTKKQVDKAAKEYIKPSFFNSVVVGPQNSSDDKE